MVAVTSSRVRGGSGALRARAGAELGSPDRRLRGFERVLRHLPRAGRRLLHHTRLEARDLSDLLVAGPDAGPPERTDGERPGVPQLTLEQRIEREGMVRAGPQRLVPGPHPASSRRHDLRRAGCAHRCRHLRPVDETGVPTRVSPRLRRLDRAVQPMGRRASHRRVAVPELDHDLGLPNVPRMDGAVRHGTRPRSAPHRSDPRSDRLPVVAASPERRGGRRHVWPRCRPSVPRLRTLACAIATSAQRNPRRPGGGLGVVARGHAALGCSSRPTNAAGAT